MHKNEEKRVLMCAHAVMVFIVVLEINEAPFPQIFSIVCYRVLQPHITFGINALFNKTKQRRSPIFEFCK